MSVPLAFLRGGVPLITKESVKRSKVKVTGQGRVNNKKTGFPPVFMILPCPISIMKVYQNQDAS